MSFLRWCPFVHFNTTFKIPPTAMKIHGDKVYTNFRSLNVPEDGVKCISFTIISIDFLLVYENKYYLQVYVENCVYKIVNTEILFLS